METGKNRRILCVIDGSYLMYYVAFAAVNRYTKKYPEEASTLIKPVDEVDQENLPDLLVSSNFQRVLKDTFAEKCMVVDDILQQNFQGEIDTSDSIDYLFALDAKVTTSFRKDAYPEYKATRIGIKRSYNVSAIKRFIERNLVPEFNLSHHIDFNLVRVDGAEGDDVIACTLKNFNDYFLKVLIASDHDFCQLDGIRQFNLEGKEIIPTVTTRGENIRLTPREAKLVKIISGDGSDNIPAIAPRIGQVTAYRMIQDMDDFKHYLFEHQDAARQFVLNKKLVDFDSIPKDLESLVVEEVSKKIDKSIFERQELKTAFLSKMKRL